jgi:hypothetical protein
MSTSVDEHEIVRTKNARGMHEKTHAKKKERKKEKEHAVYSLILT